MKTFCCRGYLKQHLNIFIERERRSPEEREVPEAAEAAPAGTASCARASRPLCGGGFLPPPPPPPLRRRALQGSCSASAGGGRAPSGPRDVEGKGGAPLPSSRRGSSGPCAPGSRLRARGKLPRRARRSLLRPSRRCPECHPGSVPCRARPEIPGLETK